MEATELIKKCKAGEREALHLLYRQYRTRLLTVCRQYTKDEETAEDMSTYRTEHPLSITLPLGLRFHW